MSEPNIESSPGLPAPQEKKVKPVTAYAIIVGYTAILFVIGILVGKLFFWNTYNDTSLADRQISSNQEQLKAKPNDPKVLTDLGWAYFQKGEYNQALTYYKQAIDRDKNYFPAHLNLGIAYIQAKKYDLAVDSLKTAVSLDPQSALAHLNLGVAYNNIQKYQDAINELIVADETSPGNAENIYQLGLAYEKLEKFDEAAHEYQDALSFDPKYEPANQGLSRVKDKASTAK